MGNTPWKDTKNPNYIKPGSLIRLGPVYHLPVRTEVALVLFFCLAKFVSSVIYMFWSLLQHSCG